MMDSLNQLSKMELDNVGLVLPSVKPALKVQLNVHRVTPQSIELMVMTVQVTKLASVHQDIIQKLELHAFKATVKPINSVLNAKKTSNCVSDAIPRS